MIKMNFKWNFIVLSNMANNKGECKIEYLIVLSNVANYEGEFQNRISTIQEVDNS